MRKQTEYDDFEFDGHEVLGRYWVDGWVKLAIIPVDIATDRGTKWETDVKCENLSLSLVYDSVEDKQIDPTPEIEAAVRDYFETYYTPNP